MTQEIREALPKMMTQNGQSLEVLTNQQPVMIVFLRHFGCLFCMEAMRDIAARRVEIEARNVKICFVHMAESDIAASYFAEYGVGGIDHVSDPECTYYEAFGLTKAEFGQLFGLKVWLRSAELTLKDLGALRRKRIGDGFQMPGVFLISDGKIIEKYINSKVSDRPDYAALSACCTT